MPIRKLKKDHPLSVVHDDLLKELESLNNQPTVVGADTLVKPFDEFFAEFEKDDRSPAAIKLLENKHKEAISALKKLLCDSRLNNTQNAILDRFGLFHPKDEDYYCAREALRITTNNKDKDKNPELCQLGADLLERIDNYHEQHTKYIRPENDAKSIAENKADKKHKETFTEIYKCLKEGIDRTNYKENADKLKKLVTLLPKKRLSYVGRIVRGIGIFLIAMGILFTLMSLTLLIITSGGAAPVVAAPLALATLTLMGGLTMFLKRFSLFGKHTQEYQKNQEMTGIKHQLGLFQRDMLNPPVPAPEPDESRRISPSLI